MASNNDDNPVRWKDNPKTCPPFEEIVAALQDRGKFVASKRKNKEKTEHKFPLLEKLVSKLRSSALREFSNPEGTTKNVHRGKKPLIKDIVLSVKHTGVTELPREFPKFGSDGKVFTITSSLILAGIDICVDRFQDFIAEEVVKRNTAQTANDGLRLGCIMLDPQFRESVNGTLSKKKSRKKSDISGDPATHFFEDILHKCFLNPDHEVLPPSNFDEHPEDEKGKWNPSDFNMFEHERTGEWLRAAWEEHLKPKHKKALDKWNKNTGGGDGTPASFVDCCSWDRWLVWLLSKDMENNFLLASSAGGLMPKGPQVESGFDPNEISSVSDNGDNVSDQSQLAPSTASKRKREVESEIASAKKARMESKARLDKVMAHIESKQKQEEGEQKQSLGNALKEVATYSQMMVDKEVLNTVSPETREQHVESLKLERKSLLTQLKNGSE